MLDHLFTCDNLRSNALRSSRLFLVLSFILYLLLHLRMQPCSWSPGSTPSTYMDLHQISSNNIVFQGTKININQPLPFGWLGSFLFHSWNMDEYGFIIDLFFNVTILPQYDPCFPKRCCLLSISFNFCSISRWKRSRAFVTASSTSRFMALDQPMNCPESGEMIRV